MIFKQLLDLIRGERARNQRDQREQSAERVKEYSAEKRDEALQQLERDTRRARKSAKVRGAIAEDQLRSAADHSRRSASLIEQLLHKMRDSERREENGHSA